MKRRGVNWKPRLSAGGANRTNMQGIMSRYQQPPPPEEVQVISDRGSDLMPPIRRGNSFRPFESRLQPHYRSPPRCYSSGYWEPPPPPPPPHHQAHPPRYAREPDVLLNDKGRPIPRRGMFLNAKYSAPPPEIDEDQVRHTEDVIRRMVRKSRRSEQFSLNAPSNYQLRDSIRQAVYDQGVPDYFRVREPIYDEYEDVRAPSRRHPSSHHHSATYSMSSRHHHPRPSSRYSRGDRRVEFEDEEEDIGYDSDEEDVFEPPPKMKKSRYEEEERPSRKIRRRHVEEERDTSSDEEDVVNRSSGSKASRASRASRTSNKRPKTPEERPSSRGSKSSKSSHHCTPTTPAKYIKDSDPEDEIDWKRGVPFMCDERGAAVLDRVGSAIQRLPLRDDAKNSYSQVAMMLLERSMKNLEKPAAKESFRPQSRLQDMTGSWERTPRQKSREEDVPDVLQKTSILRDISKIQNPQNASTLQIDQSLFAIPRLYDVDVAIDEDWMSRKKTRMPPPLHRSSPLSVDVFRSDNDVITAPSSIRKAVDEVEMTPSFFVANPNITCNASPGGSMITSLDPRDFGSRTMHFNAQFEFSPRRKKGAVKPMVDMDEEGEKEMEKEFSRMSNQARFAF
ncbi:hypothetical protein B9Z55_004745 [Caenorhabditis nigoni]|nr:hypothetical protein B9Z55_004745 [Caenorhabditis nigoni]